MIATAYLKERSSVSFPLINPNENGYSTDKNWSFSSFAASDFIQKIRWDSAFNQTYATTKNLELERHALRSNVNDAITEENWAYVYRSIHGTHRCRTFTWMQRPRNAIRMPFYWGYWRMCIDDKPTGKCNAHQLEPPLNVWVLTTNALSFEFCACVCVSVLWMHILLHFVVKELVNS